MIAMASSTNEAVQPATTYAEATEAEKHAVLRKVTGSSFLGNFIEWFDYASYSYLATVIAMVFFPAEDRAVAVMSTSSPGRQEMVSSSFENSIPRGEPSTVTE